MHFIEVFINKYLIYKKQTVNKKSYICCVSKLRNFAYFVSTLKIRHISEVKKKDIKAYAARLSEAGLSRVTIDKYIQYVHNFFEWLINDEEQIDNNPAKIKDKFGKVVDNAAVPFDAADLEVLKREIKPRDPQLWLACCLIYYAAIRPNEVRLLKVRDINLNLKQITVRANSAKNSRTEIVDVPDALYAELQPFRLHLYDSDFFVFSRNGTPSAACLGENTLRNRFNHYKKLLGIDAGKKFYSFKHTGAIDIIEHGARPYDLMEHLRHKDFATTEKYLKKRVKDKSKRINNYISEI